MGKGRPRKCIEQHLKDGTYRPGRHGPIPEHLKSGYKPAPRPAAPKKAEPGEAAIKIGASSQDFWDFMMRTRGDTIRDSDAATLALMCEYWVQISHCLKDLSKSDSTTRRHHLSALKTATDAFDKLASRFGLTPADRGKVMDEQRVKVEPKVETRPKTKMDSMALPNLKIAGA